jgi:hypothetical protein
MGVKLAKHLLSKLPYKPNEQNEKFVELITPLITQRPSYYTFLCQSTKQVGSSSLTYLAKHMFPLDKPSHSLLLQTRATPRCVPRSQAKGLSLIKSLPKYSSKLLYTLFPPKQSLVQAKTPSKKKANFVFCKI